MSRCRVVLVTFFCMIIVPRMAHGRVNVPSAARNHPTAIGELAMESDPSESQSCSSLGQLDIAFSTEGSGPPKVGMVVTDPRGRRIGFDPIAERSWDELPEAEGRIVCDPLSDRCDGRVQVCGPVSGRFRLEVIGEQTATYSLRISAQSREIGLQSFSSWDDLKQVAIERGGRNIISVYYSRDREQKIAVQREQPIPTQDSPNTVSNPSGGQ